MIARRALLRSAAALPIAGAVPAATLALSPNDRRLRSAVDTLDALQARADRHAADATADPDDPYTLAVADIDRVVADMAALPADSLTGVMAKVRALAVPIAGQDDDSPLPLSVCRDMRRLHAAGVVA